jgi:transcription initiation factor TFIIIB Brf1 subunit/transcription initiation factor TFIIB
MKCPKCKGLMCLEHFSDYVRYFEAWKCSRCGEVIDATIVSNRARKRNHTVG